MVTLRLAGSATGRAETLQRMRGLAAVRSVAEEGDTLLLTVTGADEALPLLFAAAHQSGSTVEWVRVRAATLDEVYLSATDPIPGGGIDVLTGQAPA